MTFNDWMMILFGGFVLALLALIVKFSLGISGVDRAAARRKIKLGATVIDVRAPGEYGTGHYEGAKNIPLQELQNRLVEVGDRQNPIVVYCASGARSAQAAVILSAAGFTDVTNAGGLKNLKR